MITASTAATGVAGARDVTSDIERGVASEDAGRGRAQRVLGLAVAGVGLIGFGAGVVLGRERAKRDDASAHCSVDVCQSMASLLIEDARSQSNTAFRLMTAGALAMASGVAFYLAAPTGKRWSALSGARIALGAGGLTFKTTF